MMGASETPRAALGARSRLIFLGLALVGAIAALAGAMTSPHDMWANVLLVSYYMLTLGLGALCFIAIEYASGSTWSIAVRRVPETLSRLIPIAGAGIIAAIVMRPELYPWTAGDFGGSVESELTFKQAWLDWRVFLARAVSFAVVWSLFAWGIVRQSRLQDDGTSPGRTITNRRLSFAFLVVFALTFSAAAFDWIMSLEPGWFSTIFAVYNFAGLFLAALAAIVVLTLWLERTGPLAGVVSESHVHDLGKLFFAMSTFWMYIWFSQYMLIWYADIPEETVYFVSRTNGGWERLMILNVILNWIVPFVVLMRRDSKKNRRVLMAVALIVLVGRWVDLYLMILPPVIGERAGIGVFEVGLAAGGIGFCGLVVTAMLRSGPALPIGDPHLQQSLRYHS